MIHFMKIIRVDFNFSVELEKLYDSLNLKDIPLSSEVVTAILANYADNDDFTSGFQFFMSLADSTDFTKTVESWNILLHLCETHKLPDIAFQVTSVFLEDYQTPPNDETISLFLTILRKGDYPPEVCAEWYDRLFDLALEPGIGSMNALSATYAQWGDFNGFFRCLAQMPARGLKPNQDTFDDVIPTLLYRFLY